MPANHKYPAWSDEERSRLTALWRDHEIGDIARILKRSVSGCFYQARTLGLGLPFHETSAKRPWTEAEDARLAFLWGERDLVTIASTLKRSAHAVTRRASTLKLGLPNGGGKSMNEFVRSSGYALSRIRFAMEHLGIQPHHRRRSAITQKPRVRDFCITEEQEETILDWLKTQPDGKPLLKPTGKKTQAGVWGIGLKPACCVACSRDDKPHYARGRCASCYKRQFKKVLSSARPLCKERAWLKSDV